ncbi:LD-carboxypeptidase [Cerasibacillus terrae]|uniref:LD-carboxypeptidase n=1 Tax=Cerasibacillus terrae TaxID=2498845 RepID=A0A5C8P090_9BACI|nr:LD-carboxypeptidase [Cerasibacillus terrae]TXL66645.1 LD-carboxypeptidase [Cerasibacillus terrae]
MILPNRIHSGDTVGVISPAGAIKEEELMKALYFFESLSLNVKLGKHVTKKYGYLAGTDEERVEDFHEMIRDPEIKAIFCTRGGYGSGRIVDKLDYDLIKRNPKIIIGYSDITYLHTAIHQQANLVTFHGPMVVSDIAKEEFDYFSAFFLQYQLFSPREIIYSEAISTLTMIHEGKANGQLVGGNLSVLVSTIGTPYEIDMKGKIVFLEDTGEPIYKIDSMLNQLKYAGKLDEMSGMVLGHFDGIEDMNQLKEVFSHYLSPLDKPAMMGLDTGHCFPHYSIPLGVNATLDTKKKRLDIEPGVL